MRESVEAGSWRRLLVSWNGEANGTHGSVNGRRATSGIRRTARRFPVVRAPDGLPVARRCRGGYDTGMKPLCRIACRRTHGLLRTGLLASAVLAAGTGAVAQTVVGVVVEAGTGRPVPGAFVRLEQVDGGRGGSVLAGADGTFVLRAGGPGRYRLIAERIGYRDPGTTLVELDRSESVRVTLAIPVRPVDLEGIRAEVGERCRARPDAGLATARLWEEARKALEVARWTASEAVARYSLTEFTRERSASSLEVLDEDRNLRSGFYSGSPYRAVSPESLAEHGFVRDTAGEWLYLAPDAEVLMSDAFLDSHCFRLVPGDDGLVGLGLEPVPGRDVPEIEGVLWLDAASGLLRRLEFRYVNLPFAHGRNWDRIGGQVEFEQLANGVWIVRRWYIRMPGSARMGGSDWRPVPDLVTVIERGAEVVPVPAGG